MILEPNRLYVYQCQISLTYYAFVVEQDLLTDWVMVTYTGGLDSKLGKISITKIDNPLEALQAKVKYITRKRKGKDYQYVRHSQQSDYHRELRERSRAKILPKRDSRLQSIACNE